MDIQRLPSGYNFEEFIVYDWTPALTISRHVDEMGWDCCECWVGTFWLVTDGSGGYQSERGIALGFDRRGWAVWDGQWDGPVPVLDLAPPGFVTHHPLTRYVELAPIYASYAELLLPAVDEAFAIGANLERTLATLDSNPELSGTVGERMKLVLGLLWVAEDERRKPRI